MWTRSEPQAKVLQKAFGAFEKKTGIHVEAKWVGREVLTNVSADLNGGTLPDLVDQDAGELKGTFSAADAAEGLNSVCHSTIIGENKQVCSVLPTKVMDRYQTADHQFMMIPYELISSALWFNGSQLPSVASNAPSTWPQFMGVLNSEKSKGRYPLALDGDQGEYTSYWWTWAGVRHAGPGALDKAVADKTGKSWDNPALLAAAKDIQSLVDGHYFTPNYTGTKWPAQQTAWANGEGKSDFLLMGSWAPSETAPFAAKNPHKFTYRSMPYPNVPGGQGNGAVEESLIGFAVPKNADNPQNAEKFIRFFLNKKYLSGISKTALNLTPRHDIPVPPQLSDLKKQVATASDTFQPDDGITADYPQFASEYDYPLATKLLDGRLTAQQFIAQMKAATIEYWKNHG